MVGRCSAQVQYMEDIVNVSLVNVIRWRPVTERSERSVLCVPSSADVAWLIILRQQHGLNLVDRASSSYV